MQIRDVETWRVCPGVKCGNLGPKIAWAGKDNGWASFDHVRVPRSNMMMKFCEVSRDGEFSITGDPRALYSVMMGIRMQIVFYSGRGSLVSTGLALRYCCVRRQFSTQEQTRDERKVIDYQTTQYTVAKLLASSLTMLRAGIWATEQYHLMIEDVKREVFTRMDQNHHVLSGFKALFSELNLKNTDEARRLCGGAGYQSSSGLPAAWSLFSANVTLEGENTLMLGQATRYLVKLYRKVQGGKTVAFPFTYLNGIDAHLKSKS